MPDAFWDGPGTGLWTYSAPARGNALQQGQVRAPSVDPCSVVLIRRWRCGHTRAVTTEIPTQSLPQPRRRVGCLGGCLGGLLKGLILIVVAGVVVTLGLSALLAPWNFYFGGHFHIIPGWQGWGRLHSTAAGGDYNLWIRLNPVTPKYRGSPLRGVAVLCTPRGERFSLNVGGDMPRQHGTDLTAVPLHLWLTHRTSFWNLNSSNRPSLDLYGSFGHSELNMEDRGSLARTFNSDGTVLQRTPPHRPWAQENVHVTFTESTVWALSPPCPKLSP